MCPDMKEHIQKETQSTMESHHQENIAHESSTGPIAVSGSRVLSLVDPSIVKRNPKPQFQLS
jgi:hypothetical protein